MSASICSVTGVGKFACYNRMLGHLILHLHSSQCRFLRGLRVYWGLEIPADEKQGEVRFLLSCGPFFDTCSRSHHCFLQPMSEADQAWPEQQPLWHHMLDQTYDDLPCSPFPTLLYLQSTHKPALRRIKV